MNEHFVFSIYPTVYSSSLAGFFVLSFFAKSRCFRAPGMLDNSDKETDSSERQLVKQNMCNLSILSIHVADSNIRVHLERAQGEKVQNLKELPDKFVHSTGRHS